jgi:hypothetical protein
VEETVRKPWKELTGKERMYFVRNGITKARYEVGDVAIKAKPVAEAQPVIDTPLATENKIITETQPAEQPIAKEKSQLVKTGSRKVTMLAGGAALIVIGLAGFIYYLGNPGIGTVPGMASIAAIIGGGFLLYYGIKKEAGGYIVKQAESRSGVVGQPVNKAGKEIANPPNSLVIYRDRVIFEYLEHPLGMRWKCHNDNKYYFVQTKDKEAKEFRLPDNDDNQRYYDPREFANVISMPLNKKYFSWTTNLVQKIALGIMAGVILAELVGMIAIGG